MQEACGVSDRTVYRYINLLSEANIPIYFDKSCGRYRLLRPLNVDLNRIGVSESIIIAVAVRRLQRALNGNYSESISRIEAALQRVSSVAPDELSWPPDQPIDGDTQPEPMSDHLTYALILEAIHRDKKVSVETTAPTEGTVKRIIEKPAIRYTTKTWEIFDQATERTEAIPIVNISEVRIM
jgi:predicted DNA-binding transcriptional regulator YafY